MPKSIVDWFDVTNREHLEAYRVLVQTGWWPEGFIPADVGFPNCWYFHLDAKLAKAYADLILDGPQMK